MTSVTTKNDYYQYPAYFQSCYNVVMKKQASLEPGLLSVFRLFVVLRLGLTLISFWAGKDNGQFFKLIEAILLMVYLWWPKLPDRLGRTFLPVGLVLAAVGPIAGQYLELLTEFGEPKPNLVPDISLLVLHLLIPLILVGWQYNLWAVLIYCGGTAVLDVSLTLLSVSQGSPYARPLFVAILARTATFILIGYIIVKLVLAQRQQRQTLAQANTQLAQYATTLEQLAVSQERNRLARELHDTLAHTLSGISIQLEAVRTLWETHPQQARTMVEHSLATTRAGLTETRRALQALRASPLEDLGLVLAVRRLAEAAARQSGVSLHWQGIERVENLSPPVEQAIYRIAQEALENVVKHAMAHQLTVQLHQNNGCFALTVADDGCGFEPGRAGPQPHFGLTGMQERAEIIGGALEIKTQPGTGTTVRLTVK